MTYYSPTELFQNLIDKNESGLYYIRAKSERVIRRLSEDLYSEFINQRDYPISSPDPLVIYIGKASGRKGLYRRLEEELLHVGPGTFFRGIGAVMGKNPKRAITCSGVKNYCFDTNEKNEIVNFIEDNLEVAVEFVSAEKLKKIEQALIVMYRPLFNTTHNPCPSQILSRNRERCRSYAEEFLC